MPVPVAGRRRAGGIECVRWLTAGGALAVIEKAGAVGGGGADARSGGDALAEADFGSLVGDSKKRRLFGLRFW